MIHVQHRMAGRATMAAALSVSMLTVSSAVKLWAEVDNVKFS